MGLGRMTGAAQGQAARPGPDAFARRDAAIALAFLGAGSAVLLARVWLRCDHPARWLAPALLALDLLHFGGAYNTVVAANPAAGRAPEPVAQLPSGPMAPRAVGLQIERYVFGPNLGMLWRIPVADGYVSQYLSHYRDFVERASPEKPVPWLRLFIDMTTLSQVRAPYMDMAGVRYVLTTPSPLVPDQLRPGSGRLSEPIFGQWTGGASFRARQHGLNRIDVYPRMAGRAPAWVALHLKRNPTTEEHLSYVRIDNPRIHPGEPLTFYFNPIGDSAGREYHFYLDAPDAGPDAAFALEEGRFNAYAVPLASWRKLAEANETALYENPNALERAYVVHRVRQVDDDGFYAAIDNGSLDPRRAAGVHAPPAFPELAGPGDAERSAVELIAADALNVALRTHLERPGLLVVSNSWYPGWVARVGGVERPVERVNAVFQGVYLEAGSHEVRLSFEPRSARLGLAAAAAALAIAAGALMLERSLKGA